MTFGIGYGQQFGGAPLIPVAQATAEVGGAPVSFDLTDEATNTPLPGVWEHYILDHDGAGGLVYLSEPNPDVFFRVVNGKGLFNYTRSPALPGPADAFQEHGYAASPLTILEGRDGLLRAVVVAPTELQQGGPMEEFTYRVSLGLRWVPETGSWVGARMRAAWDNVNGWTTRLALEVVAADGGEPSVLATAPQPDLDDVLDIWRTQPNAELEIELRGTTLTARLSGVVEVSAQVPGDGPPSAVVLIEATNRSGTTIVPEPMLLGLLLRSLRDLERLGPAPQIPGDVELEIGSHQEIQLPIRSLLADETIKRIGGRRFQFLEDTTAQVVSSVGEFSYFFRQGEVVRILEKLETQTTVRATRDFQYERGKKKGN